MFGGLQSCLWSCGPKRPLGVCRKDDGIVPWLLVSVTDMPITVRKRDVKLHTTNHREQRSLILQINSFIFLMLKFTQMWGQPRWLSGLRRSCVHSLMIARRSLCPEKLGSNPGQGSKGINFSGWHGLDMSITVTKRR